MAARRVADPLAAVLLEVEHVLTGTERALFDAPGNREVQELRLRAILLADRLSKASARRSSIPRPSTAGRRTDARVGTPSPGTTSPAPGTKGESQPRSTSRGSPPSE